MNRPVDRDLIEALLADGSLSYREIARRADCSDYAVRAISRQLNGDPRPMKSARRPRDNDKPLGMGGWAAVGIAAAVGGLMWWVARKPPEGGTMP